ncbi:MAG: C45 family peptidase [Anaerolineae bacterium]|nr:C45 family peptidase [Anaerolineae bacterium]
MTLPLLRVTGSSYEQGRAHGATLRDRVLHNLDVYFDRFWREGGVARDEVLRRAALYREAIAAQNPSYLEGMRGIAAGAAVYELDVVALNVRYEILYDAFVVRTQELYGADGCTAFALAPEATAAGRLLLGQNWDWIPDVKGAVVHTIAGDQPETLAFTEAGIFGGKIGLNSAGLGLAINGITTTDDDWARLHKPFHVRCYEILQQTTLDAAQAVLAGSERACSGNFLIATASGEAVNVEAAPALLNVLPWQDGCIVHANHFVDPGALGVVEPPDPDYRHYSCRRHERLEERLRAAMPVTLPALQDALRDHSTEPRTICRHEDLSAPVDEQYRTVTSVVMDLQRRQMWISDGPPCSNEYEEHTL